MTDRMTVLYRGCVVEHEYTRRVVSVVRADSCDLGDSPL